MFCQGMAKQLQSTGSLVLASTVAGEAPCVADSCCEASCRSHWAQLHSAEAAPTSPLQQPVLQSSSRQDAAVEICASDSEVEVLHVPQQARGLPWQATPRAPACAPPAYAAPLLPPATSGPVAEPPPGPTAEPGGAVYQLQSWKQLSDQCKQYGFAPAGRNTELIEHLMAHHGPAGLG